MDSDFWLARWERGETGWHQDDTNPDLRALWPGLGLPSAARVFVPLCGKSLDLLWLAAQGHEVLGVELSRRAVEAFFAENGLTPETADEPPFRRYCADELCILCGDYFDLEPRHLVGVGAVYDRASLIALPPALRQRYAAHLDGLLPTRVPRLLIALEYDQDLMSGPPFAVHPQEVQALFAPAHRSVQLAERDVLAESPGLRARGLRALVERVYRLDPA